MRIIFVLCLILIVESDQEPASRHADPVVLLGKDVPELNWYFPHDLVAFRYRTAFDGWSQIPLQIDERHFQLWDRIKNGVDCK